MESNSRFQMTSKQLVFLIIGSTIAIGVLGLPRDVSTYAKQDAWISVILGAIAPLITIFAIDRLGRIFPSLTLSEIAQVLFGRLIGSLLTLGFIIYVIIFGSVTIRLFSEIGSVYFLPKTPIWVIALFGVIICIYISRMGAKVVARVNELLFYILIFALLLVLPSLSVADYTNLLPVGGAGLSGILKGAMQTSFAFAGIEVLWAALPMVTQKHEVLKAGITAIIIIILIYLMVVLTAVMVFGTELLNKIIWPGAALLKVVDIPVLERLEIFFLVPWIGLALRPTFTMLFAGSFTLIQLLRVSVDQYYRYAVAGIGLVIYVILLIPQNILQTFKFTIYLSYGFLVIGIFCPLLFFIVAKIQKRRDQND